MGSSQDNGVISSVTLAVMFGALVIAGLLALFSGSHRERKGWLPPRARPAPT